MSSFLVRIILIALVCSPSAVFAATDDELIETLASASNYKEVSAAMDAVQERLASGPPSQEFLDELMRVATTNPEVAKRSFKNVLSLVSEQGPFSEKSLLYAAEALGSGLKVSFYQPLYEVLTSDEAQPASDAVFDTLMRNLEGPHPHWSVDVLTAIPLTESRGARVGEALQRIWEREGSDPYLKARVIGKTALIYDADTMPEAMVESLLELGMTEASIYPRVAALEVFSTLPIDPERGDELGRSLSDYFLYPKRIGPDDEYVPATRRQELKTRTALSLLQLFDAPYPDYVVDLCISELQYMVNEEQTAAMQGLVATQPLNDEQFAGLARILNSGPSYSRPQHPAIDLDFMPLSDADLEYWDNAFRSSLDTTTKMQAGYRLLFHYGASSVPTAVADVAAAYLMNEPTSGLAPVSLYLVNNAVSDEERYTELLVKAAPRYANDVHAFKMYLSVFNGRNTDSLVLRYGADERQPERFRYDIVSMAGQHLEDGASLNPEVEELLTSIARNDDSTLMVQVAGRVLREHGAKTPVRVTLTDRDFQRNILGYVFLAALGINSITFFVGGIAAIAAPSGSTKAVVGRVSLWIVLSFIMLVALLLGFVGFIGHNSAPPPGSSFAMNIPAYVGTAIYVSVAWYWVRRAMGPKDDVTVPA